MEKEIKSPIKIAVVGPESTGKSFLAKELSKQFNADLVTEFAREYLEKTNGEYNQETLDFILKNQLISERNLVSKFIICDTSSIDLLVWSKYKYGNYSEYITNTVKNADYNFVLLLSPDLPYETDSLRENSALKNRIELFDLFLEIVQQTTIPYKIVNGLGEHRTNSAIKAINNHFSL